MPKGEMIVWRPLTAGATYCCLCPWDAKSLDVIISNKTSYTWVLNVNPAFITMVLYCGNLTETCSLNTMFYWTSTCTINIWKQLIDLYLYIPKRLKSFFVKYWSLVLLLGTIFSSKWFHIGLKQAVKIQIQCVFMMMKVNANQCNRVAHRCGFHSFLTTITVRHIRRGLGYTDTCWFLLTEYHHTYPYLYLTFSPTTYLDELSITPSTRRVTTASASCNSCCWCFLKQIHNKPIRSNEVEPTI